MSPSEPFFSIIIPTHARPHDLGKCLDALAGLDYPRDRFEVIVVDDGTPTSLEPVIVSFKDRLNLTLLRQPQAGPGAARNTGLAAAQGAFVAFTADDCAPVPEWLRALATRFTQAPDRAVGGRIVNGLPENSYSTSTDLLIRYLYDYYNAAQDQARFFTPNNVALPAQALRDVGGFNGTLPCGEDRELCDRWLRRGYGMTYTPEAVVRHSHPLRFVSFCQLHFRYGQGSLRYRRARASDRGTHIAFEPLAFYLNLLRYPFSQATTGRALWLTGLLGISQVANALGFVCQWTTQSQGGEDE